MPVKLKDTSLIGKSFSQKIMFGVIFWFFHLVSDMAGSNATPGAGTGIPGPVLSLAKEVSALPIFKNAVNKDGTRELSLYVSKLFNGTLLAIRDEKGKIIEERRIDFRTELGIYHFAEKQALPFIINEGIVRSFFFIRRFSESLKLNKVHNISDLKSINWKKILPAKNGTIMRMLTVSVGITSCIDLADAAIRAGLSTKENKELFKYHCALRINYFGLGRLGIALINDVYYSAKGWQIKRLK